MITLRKYFYRLKARIEATGLFPNKAEKWIAERSFDLAINKHRPISPM